MKAKLWAYCPISQTTELLRARFETNEEAKKELAEKIRTQSMPKFLDNMTKLLDQNGGEYMVGKGVGSKLNRTSIKCWIRRPNIHIYFASPINLLIFSS